MSDQMTNLLLVGIPVLIVVALIGARIRSKTLQKRRRQAADYDLMNRALAAKPPPDHILICTSGVPKDKADRSGRIMLLLIGSFAEGLSANLLALLAASGMDGVIGSVLLIEPDQRRRERFMETVPEVFKAKLVSVTFPSMPGGLSNRPPEEVLEHIERWGPRVIKGASDVCELHMRQNNGEEAALGLVFVSQGGTAITGVKAVETAARHFPLTKFYGFTALPADDRLRGRAERVLDEYRKVGVQGFVISDNWNDEVRNDLGMVAIILDFASASESADATVEQNNGLSLTFSETPGGLVTYSTFARTIPGRRLEPTHPSVPARYAVPKNALVSTILTGLKEVHRDEYQAVRLNGHGGTQPGTSRFDLVLAAVAPQDLKENEDEIVLGQVLKGQDKRNYHLLFGSITAQINPEQPLCPVVVVSLHSIKDAGGSLKYLTAPSSSTPPSNGSDGSSRKTKPQPRQLPEEA